MLVSTSRMRLTSSIRAMPRMTVRPRFSRLAQSSATAAFLEERTAMVPVSLAPPCTRRCCGVPAPTEISGESSASAIRVTMSRLRFWLPASIRWTALWLVPRTSASWVWVSPRCLRASRISPPIRSR